MEYSDYVQYVANRLAGDWCVDAEKAAALVEKHHALIHSRFTGSERAHEDVVAGEIAREEELEWTGEMTKEEFPDIDDEPRYEEYEDEYEDEELDGDWDVACEEQLGLAALNASEPVLEVRYFDLESKGDGMAKVCPVCVEGTLTVARSRETFGVLEEDMCLLCGQRVVYLDIEELRAQHG